MPEINGTTYHPDTLQAVQDVLERARQTRTRVRLSYGETTTGQDWNERWDVTGYVSRSCGPIHIPILVYNRRSMGGCGILDHCIVRIATARGNRTLYQHPTFHQPEGK